MYERETSSGGRMMRYIVIMAGVTFIAYMVRTFISMLMARQGTAMAAMTVYVSVGISVLTAIITASLNRRHVFCSTLARGIAITVMVVLNLLFNWMTGMLWRPVMEQMMASADPLMMGQSLQLASYAFNLIQFAAWAVLAYLFQRFVLYRNTLDGGDNQQDDVQA